MNSTQEPPPKARGRRNLGRKRGITARYTEEEYAAIKAAWARSCAIQGVKWGDWVRAVMNAAAKAKEI